MKQQLKRAVPAVGMAMMIGLSSIAAAHAQTLPPVKPGEVTGNINTGGSSTVGPLSIELATRFKQDGYKGEIKVDVIGSGAGIQRFCRGEYDVANSSRAMTDAEVTGCKSNGAPIQFQVGIDALTVVVNPKNNWVRSLSKKQLALIFSGEAKTWKDVDSKFPNTPIKVFSPGTDSGTYDYFTEHVFVDANGRTLPNRRDIIPQVQGVNLSENDNVLVAGVQGDPGAIGYFGYAYFEENKRKLRAVNFEGIAPNASTVNGGKYGFARPLFIISSGNIMKEKPQVAAFVNYYLSNVDKVIKKVGYFAEPANKLNEQKQKFLDATK
jgi:phosphate binding protein